MRPSRDNPKKKISQVFTSYPGTAEVVMSAYFDQAEVIDAPPASPPIQATCDALPRWSVLFARTDRVNAWSQRSWSSANPAGAWFQARGRTLYSPSDLLPWIERGELSISIIAQNHTLSQQEHSWFHQPLWMDPYNTRGSPTCIAKNYAGRAAFPWSKRRCLR